jgi:5-methyltetrahydropteroyltriglutamate--homocysteine methyltransferase
MIKVYRQEIRAPADAAWAPQLDECNMVMLATRAIALARSRGEDPIELIKKYAWVMNEIIADRPKDLTVRMHSAAASLASGWATATIS